MASTANATITAPLGPGDAAVATVFNGIRSLNYRFDRDTFDLVLADGSVRSFSYDTIATITMTVAGNITTVTVST